MAIDTANKRLSAMNVMSPWRMTLPLPDGTIDLGDMVHLLYLYRGEEEEAPSPIVGPSACVVTFRVDPPS